MNFCRISFSSIPHRDPVAPPDLPRNAPISKVFNPVKISIVEAIRNNLNIPFTNNCDKNFSQAPLFPFPGDYWLIDINEPLLTNLGFYRSTTTTVEGFAVDIVSICFDKQTLGCQLLNNFGSRFFNGHSCEFSSICKQAPLKIDNLFLI